MITYVDNSNAQQYRVLYEKATRDLMAHNSSNELVAPGEISELNEPLIMPHEKDFTENPASFESGVYYKWDAEAKAYQLAMETTPDPNEQYFEVDDITSLNQYYSYIKNLAAIDPVYTRLPLDEDNFEIDLNTRKIEVPAHFLQNGISVQGDEVAEVVYFRVNRFFDMEDLAREDIKIYIQWRSAESGPEGKLKEGVSVPWAVDYKTEPNYIIFGWPVSSNITGKAGEISFAVRFYKFDSAQQRVVYSLSTLTQTIAVKPSLDFDITEKLIDIEQGSEYSDLVLDDMKAMLETRLENSVVTSGGVQAEKPFFFMASNPGPEGRVLTTKVDSTVGNGTGMIGGIQTSEGLVEEFWLGENPNVPGLYDQPIEFKVQASSADAGKISYTWIKLGENLLVTNDFVYGNKYKVTEDTEAQPGKVYYEKVVRNGQEGYVKVENPDFTLAPGDEGYKELFERFSIATINGVGYYTVVVDNRVQNTRSQKESIRMHVKPPTEARIVEPFLSNRGILRAEDEYDLDLSVAAEADQYVHLAYQWFYNPTGEGGLAQATPIEGANAATYTIEGTNETSDVGRVGDGFYYVKVYSEMNGIGKNSPESVRVEVDGNETGVRVTHQASVPQVEINGRESYNLAEVQAIGGLPVTVEIDEVEGMHRSLDMGDTIKYQWYRYHAADGTTTDADKDLAREHKYVPSADEELEGATGATYTPTEGGYYYYCKVTNVYNGDEAFAYSPFFYVTRD